MRRTDHLDFSLSLHLLTSKWYIVFVGNAHASRLVTSRVRQQFPNRARYRACGASERASERVETETHLRVATRSCDLRCPCTADDRSGGWDVAVIFTRDARPRRGPRRGCSISFRRQTSTRRGRPLVCFISRRFVSSRFRIGLALVKRTGSVPPSGNIRARMPSACGFALPKRD